MGISLTHLKQVLTVFAILFLQIAGWAQTVKTVHLSSNKDYDCSTYFDREIEPIFVHGITHATVKGGFETVVSLISTLQYPSEYKKYEISGKVFVNAIIDKTGEMICYRIESGLPEPFINETEKLIGKLTFEPAYVGPKPVVGTFFFPLTWELEEKAGRKRRKRKAN